MTISRLATRFLLGLTAFLQLGAGEGMACLANLTPKSGAPQFLTGRLAFQASIGTAPSHVYFYDFAHPGVKQIDQKTGLYLSENPSFSSDGDWIVFTSQNSACGGSAPNYYYQTYVYNVSYGVLTPLSTCDGSSREDIRFSRDMKSVVYKRRNYTNNNFYYSLIDQLITLNANGSASLGKVVDTYFNDFTERSWPGLSPTGKYLYYYTGNDATYTETVHGFDLATGVDTVIAPSGTNANAYYATPRDLSTVLYTRPSAATKNNDQIYMQEPVIDGPKVEREMAFNVCLINNSDAAPIDEDYIVYSRPAYPTTTGYVLYVGQIGTTNIWSLSSLLLVGSTSNLTNFRGSAYWAPSNASAP